MANYNNNAGNNTNGRIEFRIIERLGVLEEHQNGWTREINIVSWNGGQPKFDLRDWDPDHERMAKGITLLEKDAIRLTKILAKRLQMDEEEQNAHIAERETGSFRAESYGS